MADRQWFSEGLQVFETGEEEYFTEGMQLNEDQADAGIEETPTLLLLTGVGEGL